MPGKTSSSQYHDNFLRQFSIIHKEHLLCIDALSDQLETLSAISLQLIDCLCQGGKILACGNGGSSADANHFVAELVVRFHDERNPLPAISLSSNSSVLTAAANDYGVEHMFSRQVKALGCSSDILLVLSTSGSSPNIIKAVKQAKLQGLHIIGLTGLSGGMLRDTCHSCITVPSHSTARIQEAHIFILHFLCHQLDSYFSTRVTPV